MEPKKLPVSEFREELADRIADVSQDRATYILTRRGRPLAVLVPVADYNRLTRKGKGRGD